MDLLLSEGFYHSWQKKTGVYTRGWADFKGEVLQDLSNIFHSEMREDEFTDVVRLLNGNFSVILETEDAVFAAVDNISSFQLYYSIEDGNLAISDSMQSIKKKYHHSLDKRNKEEFYAAGFLIGNRTVCEGIFQLQSGQLLVYNKGKKLIEVKDYFLHIHHPFDNQDTNYLCDKLEKTMVNVINRMIESIDNKTIVLFLSGGYDSKLILSTLNKVGYRNVICVSLGGFDTKDVSVAKVIAEELSYKWIRVDVSQKTWRAFRESQFCEEYFDRVAAYSAYPYIQGLTIRGLIKEGVIPRDCVVLSGNSGDAIEGADVTHSFQKDCLYSISDIKESLRYKHYTLNGYKESLKVMGALDISQYVDYVSNKKDGFTDEECEEIFELFNWRERQSKFVVSDLHNYEDIMGLDWRLPLWDKEFQEFWLGVAYDQRYDRKLYYQYVKAELLPSANTVSIKRKVFNKVKDILGTSTYFLYIPKSIWNYLFSTKYYFATYGLIYFNELMSILKTGSGNREPHMEGLVRLIYSHY